MMLVRNRPRIFRRMVGKNTLRGFPSPYLGMISHTTRAALAAGLLASSVACGRVASSAEAAAPGVQQPLAPPLIVFITVDQLRGDMLDQYRGDLRLSFARLMRGAVFADAFQ